MSMIRVLTTTLLAAGLCVGATNVALAQGIRPEVGKPLQQASVLLKGIMPP